MRGYTINRHFFVSLGYGKETGPYKVIFKQNDQNQLMLLPPSLEELVAVIFISCGWRA